MRKTKNEGFERQEKENQRIWQAIDKLTQAIDKLDKSKAITPIVPDIPQPGLANSNIIPYFIITIRASIY